MGPGDTATTDIKTGGTKTAEFWALAAVLATLLLTVAIYAQVLHHQFVTYDDPEYITDNPIVRAGLTAASVKWALTTLLTANWIPLVWLSHMADCQVFGLYAGGHLIENVLLYAATVALLFLAFLRMTGKPWRCVLMAGIFALHPLHVESVAWASERKDTLSGFFAALTLFFYARYAPRPSLRGYVPVALSLALGLLSKPMLVTWPFVLLLLDIWPLARFDVARPDWKAGRRLLLEKIPLLLFSALAAFMTYAAHLLLDNPIPFSQFSLRARLANAAVSYATYLGEFFWPADLAVLYPYHRAAAPQVAAAAALLAALTYVAVVAARRRPYLLVGWLWFLGTLVPVSGLVQVGIQSMADRFMYLPLLGLALVAAWGCGDVVEAQAARRTRLPQIAAALAGLALAALAAATGRQLSYWKDSITLYRHTLAVTENNPLIVNNLAVALHTEGRDTEAMEQYRAAIRLQPGFATPHLNLGMLLGQAGRIPEAIVEFKEAARVKPGGSADAETSLCAAYFKLHQPQEALPHCQAAVKLDPDDVLSRSNFGIVLQALGHKAEAIAQYKLVLQADPHFGSIRRRLLALEGLKPDSPKAR
jgi:tetratricopeptide (TPR) repeat protein